MRKIFISALMLAFTATAFAQKPAAKPPVKKPAPATKPAAAPVKRTLLDSASYGFGLAMANSLKGIGVKNLNYDLMVKGLKESLAGAPGMLTPEQAQQTIQSLIASISKEKSAGTIAEGKAFLEKNRTQPGVKTTASGLQYMVLKEGTGAKPGPIDTVTVNYRGTVINGTEFDSGENATMSLGRVISGWVEGLQLMSEGAKYRLFLPYNLAYGDRQSGDVIVPYSTLIFDIDLIKVTRIKQ